MKALYQSLLKAQVKIDSAVKDSNNPHFKSKYASLESVVDAIKKPLNDNGIVIMHTTEENDGVPYLKTSLIHADSGDAVSSSSRIINNKGDMQGYGSAVTYLKRYNLTALTNLPIEDDDGNASTQPQAPQKKTYQKDPYMFNDGGFKGKKFHEIMPEDFDIYLGKLENIEADKKTAAVNELIAKMKQFKAEKQNAKSK